MDSGREKSYSENGKTLKEWKNKQLVTQKQWNGNGVLVTEIDFPKSFKNYWDDGKIKAELTGTIAEENGDFKIKEGTYNMYDSNGKITNSAIYKDFQVISEKK